MISSAMLHLFNARLAADPELRDTTSGKRCATCTFLVNSGDDNPPTAFRVVFWESQAGFINKYSKGDAFSMSLRPQTRKWRPEGADNDVYITEWLVVGIPLFVAHPAGQSSATSTPDVELPE